MYYYVVKTVYFFSSKNLRVVYHLFKIHIKQSVLRRSRVLASLELLGPVVLFVRIPENFKVWKKMLNECTFFFPNYEEKDTDLIISAFLKA